MKNNLGSDEYYQYVAYCLIEGMIFKRLKDVNKYLIGSTKEILDKGNMSVKVTKFLNQLRIQDIDTKAKL